MTPIAGREPDSSFLSYFDNRITAVMHGGYDHSS